VNAALASGGLWPTGLDAGRYAAMGAMVFGGACLQGIGGLGFAMFCAPLALLLFPELVPGPLLALGCPLAVLAMLREFRFIEWSTAGYALLGRVGGALLATAVLQFLSAPTLSVLFSLLILGGVGLSLRGWQVTPTPVTSGTAGFASGLMGTITSAGAPPLAIAMQNLPPAPLRATLGCVFFAGSVISLAALHAVGKAGAGDLFTGLLLTPWMVAGFAASGPIARRLSGRSVRGVLLSLAALGALAVLAQTLFHTSP
jgi:uncharacterized membrane protein YfcA